MEWIFGIVLIGALTYAGVELAKHFLPSWYDANMASGRSYLHDKVDELSADVKTLVAKLTSGSTDNNAGGN